LIKIFNEYWSKVITLGANLCVDELISCWKGKDGVFEDDGMPNVMKIERKPVGIGDKLRAINDAMIQIILGVESVKSKFDDSNIDLSFDKNTNIQYGARTRWSLRFSKPWHGSGRNICADSAFASVEAAISYFDKWCFFTKQVKSATRYFLL